MAKITNQILYCIAQTPFRFLTNLEELSRGRRMHTRGTEGGADVGQVDEFRPKSSGPLATHQRVQAFTTPRTPVATKTDDDVQDSAKHAGPGQSRTVNITRRQPIFGRTSGAPSNRNVLDSGSCSLRSLTLHTWLGTSAPLVFLFYETQPLISPQIIENSRSLFSPTLPHTKSFQCPVMQALVSGWAPSMCPLMHPCVPGCMSRSTQAFLDAPLHRFLP